MTAEQYTRARLAQWAWEVAGRANNLQVLRAVCYVLRNRIKAGWHGGSWLDNLLFAFQSEGNDEPPIVSGLTKSPLEDQNFIRLLRDVDEIFYGSTLDDVGTSLEEDKASKLGPCLYFHFVDEPVTEWFKENIIRDPDHARGPIIGKMIFYR